MAKMFPKAFRKDEALSAAEEKLFRLFESALPDPYVVFHSRSFHAMRQRGSMPDGINDREIDFLVAHPQLGILIIESKGGGIQIDGDSDQWWSVDRMGARHQIKNPFRQAKDAAYDLFRLLRDDPEMGKFYISFGYVAALPDSEIRGDLGLTLPRAALLDRTDLRPDRVEKALERAFQHYHRADAKPLGKDGLQTLARKLAPNHYLRSRLASDFEDESARIKELTDQQFEALSEILSGKKRYLVTGCAGSGKTLIALEIAAQLAEAGKQVLYTCFNTNLSLWLNKTMTRPPNLTISTFHMLCRDLCLKVGRALEHTPAMEAAGVSASDYYEGVMPNALRMAVDQLDVRYDAILVDEGQDFKQTFWSPLFALLRDPAEGMFYIFCDDNQRIYSHDALPFTEPSHHLRKNLRNTFEIGDLVGKYHHGSSAYLAAGPRTNRQIEIIPLTGEDKSRAMDRELERVLRLLFNEGVRNTDLVILTPLRSRSHWADGKRVGEYRIVRGLEPADGKPAQPADPKAITVETIHSFKGLERSVVILTELERARYTLGETKDRGAADAVKKVSPTMAALSIQELMDIEKPNDFTRLHHLLYVALSRARNHLIVLGDLPQARP